MVNASEGHSLSSSQMENLAAAHVDQSDDSLNPDKKAKKKQRADKPSSVSFVNRDTQVKDLFASFSEKTAKSNVKQFQGKLDDALQQKLKDSSEKFFKKEFQDKSQDQVVLSQMAQQKNAGKKEASREESETGQFDSTPEGEGELGLKKGLRGLQETAKKAAQSREVAAQQQLRSLNPARSSQAKAQVETSLKQYLSMLGESLVKGDPKQKRDVKAMRQKLEALGLTNKKLNEIEKNVQKFVAKDFKKQLKQSFVQMALNYTPRKINGALMENTKAFNELAEYGEMEGLLFDTDRDEAKKEARDDLKSFLSHELDQSIIEAKVNHDSPKALIDAFNRFNDIASLAQFNAGAYMKTLNKKIEDLGLNRFVPPEESEISVKDDEEFGDNHQDQTEEEETQDKIEELEDQLRTLFMQASVERGPFKQVEIQLKIRKLKKGMKKLGIYSDDTMARLKKEGQAFAKLRLVDLVREAFEERATLADTKSTAFKMATNKLKTALKGLKKLRASVPKEELKEIRDQVNQVMFSIVKEDYIKLEVQLKANPGHVILSRKVKELLTLLERLKEESDIKEDITPKMFQNTNLAGDSTITEAA